MNQSYTKILNGNLVGLDAMIKIGVETAILTQISTNLYAGSSLKAIIWGDNPHKVSGHQQFGW